MQRASPIIVAVVEPVVTGLGFDFVGAEFGQAENGQTLRIYIDTVRESGIVIEDCATVSRQLNAVLDVEDTIKSAYLLEVSSPGVDRPLFTEAQFAAQLNENIRVKMATGVGGRRNYKGRLVRAEAGTATVEVDGIDYDLPLDDIDEASLIGRIGKRKNEAQEIMSKP